MNKLVYTTLIYILTISVVCSTLYGSESAQVRGIIPPYIDPDNVMLKSGDTMTGALDMGTNTIIYSGQPIEREYKIPVINTSVYSSVYDMLKVVGSDGVIHGGELTYNTSNDTICVSNGFGMMFTGPNTVTASCTKNWRWFSWTNSCFNMPANTTMYIYAVYDPVQPYLEMQDSEEADIPTKFEMYKFFLEDSGAAPYVLATYDDLNSVTHRENLRLQEQRALNRASGLRVTFISNYFVGAEGVVYYGMNRHYVPESDTRTPGATFDAYWYDGAGGEWEETRSNQLDNANYNSNGYALVAASNGAYLVYWLFYNTSDRASIVYGQHQYASLALAQAAVLPTVLPAQFAEFTILICQVITTNGAYTPLELRYATDVDFKSAQGSVTDHDALTSLNTASHPAYLLKNGTRAMTGDLNMGNKNISNAHSVIIGTDADSNSFFTVIQTMATGGRAACAYMWGTNPPTSSAVVGPVWSGRRARGTQGTPLAVSNGDVLVSIAARGYDGTSWGELSDGQMAIVVAEPFTPTAKGTYFSVKTTTTGTTSRVEQMTVDQWGIHGAGTFVTNVNASLLSGQSLSEIKAYNLIYYVQGPVGPKANTLLASLHDASGLPELEQTLTNIADGTVAGYATIATAERPHELHNGLLAKLVIMHKVEGTTVDHNVRAICNIYNSTTNLVQTFNGATVALVVGGKREETLPITITNGVPVVASNYFVEFAVEFVNGWDTTGDVFHVYLQNGNYTRIELGESAAGVYALESDLAITHAFAVGASNDVLTSAYARDTATSNALRAVITGTSNDVLTSAYARDTATSNAMRAIINGVSNDVLTSAYAADPTTNIYFGELVHIVVTNALTATAVTLTNWTVAESSNMTLTKSNMLCLASGYYFITANMNVAIVGNQGDGWAAVNGQIYTNNSALSHSTGQSTIYISDVNERGASYIVLQCVCYITSNSLIDVRLSTSANNNYLVGNGTFLMNKL